MKLKMRSSYIVIATSILLAILSISVIAGWYAKNQALVQVHPSFALSCQTKSNRSAGASSNPI